MITRNRPELFKHVVFGRDLIVVELDERRRLNLQAGGRYKMAVGDVWYVLANYLGHFVCIPEDHYNAESLEDIVRAKQAQPVQLSVVK